MTDAAGALRQLLDDALDMLAAGDAAAAERQAKAVSALVRAERDVGELAAALPSAQEEDEEGLRAELRRRLALYVEADLADAPLEVLERIALTGSAE